MICTCCTDPDCCPGCPDCPEYEEDDWSLDDEYAWLDDEEMH